MNSSTIDASIYDNEEGGWGEVTFYPFEAEPVPCAPTLEEPYTFTTADAVIALQIAVGSRPLDLQWGVSRQKSLFFQIGHMRTTRIWLNRFLRSGFWRI